MTQQFSEGDHVFYRGPQLPWGHAEVLADGDGDRYVLVALDHCGVVCADVADLSPWGEGEQQVTEGPVPVTPPPTTAKGSKP